MVPPLLADEELVDEFQPRPILLAFILSVLCQLGVPGFPDTNHGAQSDEDWIELLPRLFQYGWWPTSLISQPYLRSTENPISKPAMIMTNESARSTADLPGMLHFQ